MFVGSSKENDIDDIKMVEIETNDNFKSDVTKDLIENQCKNIFIWEFCAKIIS